MPRAAHAVAALLAVQMAFVLGIVVADDLTDIRAVRDIGAICAFEEHSKLIPHPVPDELGGLRGYVNANPLTLQCLGGDAGRTAAAKGIQQYIVLVAASGDYTMQERQWFLGRIADAFRRLWRD